MMFLKGRVQRRDGVCWCSKTTVSCSARAESMTAHVLLTRKEDVGSLEYNAVVINHVLLIHIGKASQEVRGQQTDHLKLHTGKVFRSVRLTPYWNIPCSVPAKLRVDVSFL